MTNFSKYFTIVILGLLLLAGCSTDWRMFQAEVPKPLVKTEDQIEAERRSADLIAKRIETPVELKPVAVTLSESLGKPNNPIADTVPIKDASKDAVADLTKEIAGMQRQLLILNRQLIKYQGKEIEGTGINLFGPTMTMVILGLIVLAFVCPPVLTILFFIFRRTASALKNVATGVESYTNKTNNQAEVDKLLNELSRKMDRPDKDLIDKIKLTLPKPIKANVPVNNG